jgi:hypothetical protein
MATPKPNEETVRRVVEEAETEEEAEEGQALNVIEKCVKHSKDRPEPAQRADPDGPEAETEIDATICHVNRTPNDSATANFHERAINEASCSLIFFAQIPSAESLKSVRRCAKVGRLTRRRRIDRRPAKSMAIDSIIEKNERPPHIPLMVKWQ